MTNDPTIEHLRHFKVEQEYICCDAQRVEVASDGEEVGKPWVVEADPVVITLGYTVWELNEGGTTNSTKFYPVHTNTETMEDDSQQVLEQIKADYPAGEWQNNEW